MSRTVAERVFASLVAVVLLAVALPVIIVAAIISATTYRTWPFFTHDRVGKAGHLIRITKIRTLPPQTAAYADKYQLQEIDVPKRMRLLRTLHVDELPQLWRVVTGEMAFVGPRPEMPGLHDRLGADFGVARTAIEPGLTGLWQISPHNAGLIGERPEYDLLYINHRSPQLDLWIMGRTLRKMTLRQTTHLFEVPLRTVANLDACRPAPAPGAAVPRIAPGVVSATTVD